MIFLGVYYGMDTFLYSMGRTRVIYGLAYSCYLRVRHMSVCYFDTNLSWNYNVIFYLL